MCTSRCGVLATIENGKLTQVNADRAHPNGCICAKGAAAPEIVYAPDRLRYPLARTRPKNGRDPGWVRIGWDQAFERIATRLNDLKATYGPETVVFSRATTAGSAAIDFDVWIQRLANAFGSPNLLTSNHICTWNRKVGSKYTYGVGLPTPDFDHTRCMLLWGINPQATSPAQAARITQAKNRGATLIVIDPRSSPLACKADCWLRVRPGTDGALAMAMIHVLLEENLYDTAFVRSWTNAPFLVREDRLQCLTERDLRSSGNPNSFMVVDEKSGQWVSYEPARGYERADIVPALSGRFKAILSDGTTIYCRPALELLRIRAAAFSPEGCASVTSVPAREVRRAVALFSSQKPSCYCTWVGLEQDADAMQTNRAVCIFYALSGQFDGRGSNVIFDHPPTNDVTGRRFLSEEMALRRLGIQDHPLGPPHDPGLVQAAQVYQAILTGRPYPVKALVCFGSDPLLGHGDTLKGKAALEALDFYTHVDLFENPSARFADLLLPAASCWEREALMPGFDVAENTVDWIQLRPAVVAPLHQSRSDTQVIFDLAKALGLSERFFGGDIDAALNHQLAPSGLTVGQLRDTPGGVRAPTRLRYEKYKHAESHPKAGFNTPTRKIEIFSTTFARAGYAPLPEIEIDATEDALYPLTLTFFRDIHFCDEQHRNIPRLRRTLPEPFMEIHPHTATQQGIAEGDWISLETSESKIKLKAKFNEELDPTVVTSIYGWWQSCKKLKLPGYDPFKANGANSNLLISNSGVDPISASVAHRGARCRVTKWPG